MRNNYSKYLLFLLAFAVLGQGFAQTSSKSRLNTGQKATERKNQIQQYSILGVLPVSSSTPTAKRSTAINAFYRSVLLSPTATPQPKPTTTSENIATVNADSRHKALAENTKNEDKLFVNDKISVSNVYPNPANDFAEVEFQLLNPNADAKIVVFGSLYNKIGEYSLERGERKIKISTRDMYTGNYHYQLILDGKSVATKKLLIRH